MYHEIKWQDTMNDMYPPMRFTINEIEDRLNNGIRYIKDWADPEVIDGEDLMIVWDFATEGEE